MKKVKSGSDISFSFNVKVTDKTTVDEIIRKASDIIKVRFAEYKVEPEESEDERIRKELIFYFNSEDIAHQYVTDERRERWVSYLEKQKEQKPNYCHHDVDETGWTEEYRKAYYDGWNNCNMQHEQLKADRKLETFHSPYSPDEYEVVMEGNATSLRRKEQKPAEATKDQRQIYFMIEDSRRCGVIEGRKQVIDNPEKYGLQKSAEWSEEDEHRRQQAINALDRNGYYVLVDWLKSIRPQPHWKPSEEQMKALSICIPKSGQPCTLQSLYNDLKKLLYGY